MSAGREAPAGLRRVITAGGFFALSFGSIVGSGWVVLLGDWLNRASPGGAVLAILAGGSAMVLVGLCYAELAVRYPRAGGEFVYILEAWGRTPAFVTGWFLTLYLIAICAFEGLAIAVLLQTLFPRITADVVYVTLGEAITWDALAIGLAGAAVIWGVNVAGTRVSLFLQRFITYGFIAVMAFLIGAGLVRGSWQNLTPFFGGAAGSGWPAGAAWIFGTCAVLLYGFQASIQAIEERAPHVSMQNVVRAMIGGIIAAAIFYCAVVVAAGRALPWASLLDTRLPAAAAFGALSPSGVLGTVVIVAAAASLVKTWNGIVLMAARLVLAQARAGLLPRAFTGLNRAGAPAKAIAFVSLASIAGMLLGRGAIIPIINMAAMCVSAATAICLVALLRLRRSGGTIPSFSTPGGTATISAALLLMLGMSASTFLEPLINARGSVPLEWILVLIWLVVGLAFARCTRAGRQAAAPGSTPCTDISAR
ncbi:APC family permease [Sphingosinicella microcystinivorans]|uniref:APC family permease n=1 Tax=Sphingosinicella microcystinivorans TaxID=335406 RepID=UPI0022F3EDDA|nr:APC family permease [Sphingosinicella microcystinivorans]WBX86291.1 APC family permease [Sphingosinicella microcystinivorans]